MLTSDSSKLAQLIANYNYYYDLMANDISKGNEYITVSAGFISSNDPYKPELTAYAPTMEECKNKLANSKSISGQFRITDNNPTYGYSDLGYYNDAKWYGPNQLDGRAIQTSAMIPVSSVDQAKSIAKENKSTLFGIQDGVQLFDTSLPLPKAVKDATAQGVNADCSNEMGCGNVNHVFAENNCIGYTNGSWNSGTDTILVNAKDYYSQKLQELFDEITKLIAEQDITIRNTFDTLLSVDPPDPSTLTLIEKRKAILNEIASKYDLVVNASTISLEKLKESNIIFRTWIFLFLLVIFVTFQLVKNPIAKSLSMVSLFFMIVILCSIVYIFQPLLFMILLLILFMVATLALFYRQQYYFSAGLLFIEYVVFAVIYRI